MTGKDEEDLMQQIIAIYAQWFTEGLNNEHGSRLINGLFEIAKSIAPGRMSAVITGVQMSRLEKYR